MSKSLHAIGLLFHPKKPESVKLTERMGDFLRGRGYDVWVGSAWMSRMRWRMWRS